MFFKRKVAGIHLALIQPSLPHGSPRTPSPTARPPAGSPGGRREIGLVVGSSSWDLTMKKGWGTAEPFLSHTTSRYNTERGLGG